MKYIAIQHNTALAEYRVTAPKGGEDAAYYTDDRQDAIDTAYTMYNVDKNQFPLTAQCKFYAVEEYLEI